LLGFFFAANFVGIKAFIQPVNWYLNIQAKETG
jgi:hypothetical protein